ncbi:MAG: COG4280 domain-containing protein [Aulosira sp. DedQUE10]|nr:COG4280 domain-containing protein [Aulosira sp. DedQUE10]
MNISVFIGALSSASVEFLETAAIAYAIARSGYPREAILGTITGLASVGIAVAIFGTGLKVIPLDILQVFIGIILLWFGFRWMKKSVFRQVEGKRAGWITDPINSEGIVLETGNTDFSFFNFIIMIKSAALEALEVAIIVTTLGLASNAWNESLVGVGLALLSTVAVVSLLHGYLLQVPEILIKLSAGIMLMAFGTFWIGEGLGFNWPLGDLMLLFLIVLYGSCSFVAISWLKTKNLSENISN